MKQSKKRALGCSVTVAFVVAVLLGVFIAVTLISILPRHSGEPPILHINPVHGRENVAFQFRLNMQFPDENRVEFGFIPPPHDWDEPIGNWRWPQSHDGYHSLWTGREYFLYDDVLHVIMVRRWQSIYDPGGFEVINLQYKNSIGFICLLEFRPDEMNSFVNASICFFNGSHLYFNIIETTPRGFFSFGRVYIKHYHFRFCLVTGTTEEIGLELFFEKLQEIVGHEEIKLNPNRTK